MKKIMSLISILSLVASIGVAAMDDVTVAFTAAGTKAQTNNFVLRGEIEAIYCDFVTSAGTGTNTVTLTAGSQTITKSFTADGIFYPRVALQGTTGAAITFVGGTNDTANVWYGKVPVAGAVSLVQSQLSDLATNSYSLKIIYSK